MRKILVGVGNSDISPPLGVELCGYGTYRGRRNRGIHDKLYSRSLVLGDREEALLLVSNDLLAIDRDVLQDARGMIQKKTGISNDNIIFSCTHTHSGPAAIRMEGAGESDDNYLSTLPEKFSESATAAYNSIREASLGFARSEVSDVSYNRVVAGGPVDKEVRVLQFKDSYSEPIATIYNYSCHCVTIDVRTPDGFYVSADWPGYAAKALEGNGAGECLFLQGTCGDIDPLVAWHMRGFDAAEQVGRGIAHSASRAMDEIEPRELKDMRFGIRRTRLPFKKTSMRDIADSLKDFLGQLERKEDEATMRAVRPEIRFYRRYAESMMEKIEVGLPQSLETEIQALKLNNVALIFIPGEVFVEIGHRIMERSPFRNTMVVGYSNAYVGYIPTPLDFRMRGYASTIVPRAMHNPPFREDVSSNLIEESLDLLQELTT